MSKIVELKSKQNSIIGAPSLIIEVQTLTPDIAAQWLKANNLNRPVRKRHVDFLVRKRHPFASRELP